MKKKDQVKPIYQEANLINLGFAYDEFQRFFTFFSLQLKQRDSLKILGSWILIQLKEY